jgi:predicted SprT family Zn-dependent metalloprotease
MTVTIEEVNGLYRGIVDALERLGYHPNKLREPIAFHDSVREFGTTYRKKTTDGYEYWIKISKVLAEADDTPIKLYETIAHETIHTIDGCFDHKALWKTIAGNFNAVYGTHISRTDPVPESMIENSPYVIACDGCGYRIGYHRLCKSVKHPEWYQCTRCGGNFKRVA